MSLTNDDEQEDGGADRGDADVHRLQPPGHLGGIVRVRHEDGGEQEPRRDAQLRTMDLDKRLY